MDARYGGVIWTNHALDRLRERGIKQGDAWVTLRRPQQSRYASNKGTWIYYRDHDNTRLEVVAKQNARKEWVVLSVWSSLVSPGVGIKPTGKETFLKRILRFFGLVV